MNTIAAAVMLTSALGLGVAAEALAQYTTTPSSPPASQRPAPATRDAGKPARQAWTLPAGQVASKDLIGKRVKNPQGKDIGEIDQLIVDPKDGKISHAVVGVGGVLGVGEEKRVVEWSDLKVSPTQDRDRVAITMDQTGLEKAPRFEARRGDRGTSASPATSPRTDRPSSSETKDKLDKKK